MALLHRLGGEEDITLGSPIAGRTEEGLQDLVGFFANTWVLRAQLRAEDRFTDLLEQVRQKALSAYEHQDLPFERLVELLRPERSISHHPLFQVVLAWQNSVRQELDLPGVEATMEPVATGTAKFDLFFNLMPDESGATVNVDLEYATDLFDPETVAAIADAYLRVLEQRPRSRSFPSVPCRCRHSLPWRPAPRQRPVSAPSCCTGGMRRIGNSLAQGRFTCRLSSRRRFAPTRSRCAGPVARSPTGS